MYSLSRRSLLSGVASFGLLDATSPARAAGALTFAWSPAPQMPQVDVAVAEKLFERAGLNVAIVTFPTGREAFEALTGGQADLASMAELPAVIGALRGKDFAVVADLARYTGSRIVTTSASKITTPAGLAGKRLGVTLGTNTDFFLNKVLEAAGITGIIVNAAPPDLLPALVRGDVDAIAPFPNVYPAAKKALGDTYIEIRSKVYQPHFVIAASRSALSTKAADVAKFLGALRSADTIVTGEPDKAIAAVVASLKGNIDAAGVKAIWADTEVATKLSPDLATLLLQQAHWIVAKGVVKVAKPVTGETLAPFLNAELLRSVAPDAVTVPAP
jgi:ABC-type nitrate/sulfonate/bicarbonate transport system substrate-binding protein